MPKILPVFLILIIFNWGLDASVYAYSNISYGSANLKYAPIPQAPQNKKADERIIKLKSFLSRFNSPLSEEVEKIISNADIYNIPWSLVPAIAGVESGFCNNIPLGSNNCWGWNNGNFCFLDLEEGVHIVSKHLRFYYIDKGLNTPELINKVYAPPSSAWSGKVRSFMYQIENFPIPQSPPEVSI